MDSLFEVLGKNPMWIFVIVLVVVFIIISSVKKKTPQQNGSNIGKGLPNRGATGVGQSESDCGYYRYQEDNQVVIKRTEEQQRIFEEYFVVRKYKDVTLKKKAKTLKTVSNWLLWPGIILGVIGFATGKTVLGVMGVVLVVAAIICKIICNKMMAEYNASKGSPKKLMTDAEFEKLVEDKIASMDIAKISLEKLGLDPDQVKEIHPIILRDKVIDDHSLTVRNRDNNSVHSSTQHVTYLYFTDEQLFVYKIQFDMCCNMQDEWASEFFYKDICDVSSYTSRNILKGQGFEFEYSTVSFNIIASNSQIGFDLNGDNENVGSIQAMKQKIRERKAQ